MKKGAYNMKVGNQIAMKMEGVSGQIKRMIPVQGNFKVTMEGRIVQEKEEETKSSMLNQVDFLQYGFSIAQRNKLTSDEKEEKMDPRPYSHLANEKDQIEYNGVTFHYERSIAYGTSLCLGDVTNLNNVLVVPLADGGCLKVNRDNLDDLSKAIGMFSPEDTKRILQAISQDAKAKNKLAEIEEEENKIWNLI